MLRSRFKLTLCDTLRDKLHLSDGIKMEFKTLFHCLTHTFKLPRPSVHCDRFFYSVDEGGDAH